MAASRRALTHEQMAPIVVDLFLGGLGAVRKPRVPGRPPGSPDAAPLTSTLND